MSGFHVFLWTAMCLVIGFVIGRYYQRLAQPASVVTGEASQRPAHYGTTDEPSYRQRTAAPASASLVCPHCRTDRALDTCPRINEGRDCQWSGTAYAAASDAWWAASRTTVPPPAPASARPCDCGEFCKRSSGWTLAAGEKCHRDAVQPPACPDCCTDPDCTQCMGTKRCARHAVTTDEGAK